MKNYKWICIGIFAVSVLLFTFYNLKVLGIRDQKGPEIEMETDVITVSVNDGNDVLLGGVTAFDKKDGDVTASLVVESLSDFINENERYVNYAAFDSDNHVTKASRKIIYSDYTPARFSLNGPLRVSTSGAARDVLGLIHAVDCIDGDISSDVAYSSSSYIDMYEASDYQVAFEVTNSAGRTTTLEATVTVYDASLQNLTPQILLNEYLVYTGVGEELNPEDYLDSVSYRGTEYVLTDGSGTFGSSYSYGEEPSVSYRQFTINDNVDYQTPGTYEIEYVLDDASANRGKVNLIVVVEEE